MKYRANHVPMAQIHKNIMYYHHVFQILIHFKSNKMFHEITIIYIYQKSIIQKSRQKNSPCSNSRQPAICYKRKKPQNVMLFTRGKNA